MQPLSTVSTTGELPCPTVAERPVYLREFGRYCADLREAKGWNQSDAARYAKQRGLKELTRNIILRIEAGKTKNPEPAVLRALADLYGRQYREMVDRLVFLRYGLGPDQSRHGEDQTSNLPIGGSDVPASGERDRISELEAALGQVTDVARHLIEIAAVGEKGHKATKGKTRRGSGNRKTG